jgi:hypothetical protein
VPEGPDDDRPETGSGETTGSSGTAGSRGAAGSAGSAGSPGTSELPVTVEARLREALSRAAPKGYPTIGVRESIVEAVRARHRQKQRVGLSVAACCVLIAGATVAVTRLEVGKSQSNISAAARPGGSPSTKNAPIAAGVTPKSSARLAARCAVVTAASGSTYGYGCTGVFSSLPPGTFGVAGAASQNRDVSVGQSSLSARSKKSRANPATEAAPANGADEVVVPIGRPVTVTLPSSPGEIWTSPAIESGQGQDAARVRTTSARAGVPGDGSSATFESAAPVNLVLVASELPVCGPPQAVCGTPAETWSVVLEFRKV